MAISSFFGLNTALKGLMANQMALDVTGHNIANAGTEGYTRQTASMTAASPMRLPGAAYNGATGYLGTGVDLLAFTRARDQFSDLQYRAQNGALGQYTTTSNMIGQAENNLNEPGDNGLNAVLGKFWSAWDAVSNNPDSPATRQALVDQASLLTDGINQLSGQFKAVQTDAQTQYAQLTGPNGDVQALATQIAQLNAAIKSATGSGGQPNDLLDKRDLALDKLSNLARISVTDLGNGAIKVDFGDAAQPLVDDGTVTWPQTLTSPGGQLGGLLNVGDPTSGAIANYLTDLDGFANQLASQVNAVHGSPPFFTGTTAATIGVGVTAATVKASALGPPAPPGANDIALQMSALRGGGADTAYANLVARIGGESRNATQQQATASALTQSAQNRRQSVAGVSLDEEMSQMLVYQRGYQASARVMSSMDQMIDTLINHTGSVGL